MQMNNITVLNIVIAKIWGGGEQYVFDVCAERLNKQRENARSLKDFKLSFYEINKV